MKKLLVTAIGAAVAFGACAGEISTKRFENEATGTKSVSELPGGSAYWSEGSDTSKSNTYTVGTAGTVSCPLPFYNDSPSQALDIKTTFGKPLSVNIASGGTATNIPSSGVYFDSLVKFTVCEETPTNSYTDAKIVMWLEEKLGGAKNDEVIGTNLMVRAGYLSYNSGALPPVSVTPTNYVCVLDSAIAGDFADQWHRVTIKAIPDITTGAGVPGFAIYIDGSGSELLASVSSTQDKWDSSFTLALNEGAQWLNSYKCLFPSMIQDGAAKGSLTAASFDGTGSITDIVFTDEPMAFADDYVAPKATVTIGNGDPVEFGTIAEAVAAINTDATASSPTAVTLHLLEPLVVDGSNVKALEFAPSNANITNIVFDFAGKVITNTTAYCAITNKSGAITFIDSGVGGGITCTSAASTSGAIYVGGTRAPGVVIDGGIYRGSNVAVKWVMLATSQIHISDGSFETTSSALEGRVVDGKKLALNQETGLYDVVDIVYYTVGFYDDVQGEGSLIGEEASVEAGTLATAPAAPTKTGYTFVDWTPSTNTAITANTNFYPTWSANTYTITYYDGENVLDLAPASYTYGTGVTLPESAGAKTGYTFAGWYDNAGLTGDPVTAVAASETGNQTFYAKYTATEYTITYVYGSELSGLTPTSYTVEDAITLPTVVDLGVTGVSFEAWTNAEGTVVAGWSVGDKTGNQTFYAKTSAVVSPTIFDGGDGSSFDIPVAKQEEIAAVLPSGKAMSDAVSEGSSMTYAQAYALGLLNETTGDVADLDATIELKDGKVVVNLSSAPKSAYTITLKVYEKSSLTAAWPESPTQTYTLDDPEATTGFTPTAGGTNFYKTEVSISNK